MSILLDSNIIIEVIKGKIKLKETNYFINPIVYAEVLYGLLYVGKSESEFQEFLDNKSIEILVIGTNTASIYTNLKLSLNKKGLLIADNDLFVAASCLEYSLSLYTLNLKHFGRIKDLRFI